MHHSPCSLPHLPPLQTHTPSRTPSFGPHHLHFQLSKLPLLVSQCCHDLGPLLVSIRLAGEESPRELCLCHIWLTLAQRSERSGMRVAAWVCSPFFPKHIQLKTTLEGVERVRGCKHLWKATRLFKEFVSWDRNELLKKADVFEYDKLNENYSIFMKFRGYANLMGKAV